MGRACWQTEACHGDNRLAAAIEPGDFKRVPLIFANKRQCALFNAQRRTIGRTGNGVQQPCIVLLGVSGITPQGRMF